MVSPIDPEMCKNTGRLLTEWFEYPEYTDADLFRLGAEKAGVEYKPVNMFDPNVSDEDKHNFRRVTGFIAAFKSRKWRYGMTQQEVAARMNEATKMIDPDNYKFLDDETRERTGLEINPLWQLECLVRSGTLTPKEQVAALKELAQYTHSKAPNHNINTNINAPEDWLLELSKDDYKVVDTLPSFQPKQIREAGTSKHYEHRKAKRIELAANVQTFQGQELDDMMGQVGDFRFDDDA